MCYNSICCTCLGLCADVAQLVEQLIRNEEVAGSIPAGGSRHVFRAGIV